MHSFENERKHFSLGSCRHELKLSNNLIVFS